MPLKKSKDHNKRWEKFYEIAYIRLIRLFQLRPLSCYVSSAVRCISSACSSFVCLLCIDAIKASCCVSIVGPLYKYLVCSCTCSIPFYKYLVICCKCVRRRCLQCKCLVSGCKCSCGYSSKCDGYRITSSFSNYNTYCSCWVASFLQYYG